MTLNNTSMRSLALKLKDSYLSKDEEASVDIIKSIPYRFVKEFNREFALLYKSYTYMITFTIDPERHNVKSEKLHAKIDKYIKKFPISKSCDVIRADYVREGSDKEHKHIHWHLGIETRNIFKSKTLKYYNLKFGNTDVSKSYDNNYNNVLKYINKVNRSVQLV